MLLSILGALAAAVAVGGIVYLAVKLTIKVLKGWRQNPINPMVGGTIGTLKEQLPTVSLDDFDDDDVLLLEYDEESDKIVQANVADDVDDKVRNILKQKGGAVIFT